MSAKCLLLHCQEHERTRLHASLTTICADLNVALTTEGTCTSVGGVNVVSASLARVSLGSLIASSASATIVVIGPDSASEAIWNLRHGATEYISDSILEQEPESFKNLLRRLFGQSSNQPIMHSPSSSETYRLARRVAPSDVPVFIQGPSGSGKEVLARFLHRHSLRSTGPFVAVNCAAIPENMLESTLFGHEKGAFTGADRSRDGKFLSASEGTLLLDEVTEMPVELQAKLLRAIQEKEVEPLGSKRARKTNVRIIATSNRDLKQAMEQGRLREDLYYRLNVFPLAIAPLRERLEDVLPMAESFARRHGTTSHGTTSHEITNRTALGGCFDSSAQCALLSHDWPGNVRELENRVQRAIIVCESDLLSAVDLGFLQVVEEPSNFKDRLDAQEDRLILQALHQHGGQRRITANALGMSERTLRYRLSRMRNSGLVP